MTEAAIPVFLALITALIGYATLFQKAEDVGHARPIFASTIRRASDGTMALVLTNEGGRAALAVTVTVEGLPSGAEHRDVVAPKGEVLIPLSGLAADEITARFAFSDVGRHTTTAWRVFKRTGQGSFRLSDGEDRTKGIVVTRSIPLGASTSLSRGSRWRWRRDRQGAK